MILQRDEFNAPKSIVTCLSKRPDRIVLHYTQENDLSKPSSQYGGLASASI